MVALASLESMSNLIRTPVVDKNGKQTTVHKRAEQNSSGASALASLKPKLTGGRASKPKATVKIKPTAVRELHEDSIISAHPSYFEVEWIKYGHGEYEWRNEEMEIPTARLYEYMRKGIDLTDASIFEGLGFNPEMVGEEFPEDIPGRLGKWRVNATYASKIKNQNVIDAMEEAGITPAKAYKALENGLQDGHMQHLSIDQLVSLFGKWKYYGVEGTRPEQNSSRLLDKVVQDVIPYELTLTNSRKDLSRLEGELVSLGNNPLLERKEQDRELFIRIADKAVKSLPYRDFAPRDEPVTRLYQLYDRHGEGVLDLPYPEMLTFSRHLGTPQEYKASYDGDEDESVNRWASITLEDALFAEAVADKGLEGRIRLWDVDAVQQNTQRGKNVPTLSHHDVLNMRAAGASVDQVHELLVMRGLGFDQALTVVKDGINSTIADGAL